jgi:hypothetical protein
MHCFANNKSSFQCTFLRGLTFVYLKLLVFVRRYRSMLSGSGIINAELEDIAPMEAIENAQPPQAHMHPLGTARLPKLRRRMEGTSEHPENTPQNIPKTYSSPTAI